MGTLYQRLEDEGLLENTILIVSTDHGDGLPRMKRSLYDSGLKVPLVIRYPDGFGAGTVNDELISFVDLAPTLLSWAGVDIPRWLHGTDFVGDDRGAVREYVFAAQDRMDNEPNYRRAVRDQKFKYILNDLEGDPYFEPLPFRDSQPTMKELWAGLEADALPVPAQALFEPLPIHQLYDTKADPHEINNLAYNDANAEELERLQLELANWRERVGDMSDMSEADMILEMWPNGEQPKTAEPEANFEKDGAETVLTLTSPTLGASIGYRISENAKWKLYVGPLKLSAGTTIEVKAVRYGYSESPSINIEVP